MILVDLVSDAASALIGGVIAWSATTATHRAKDRAASRRAAADTIVPHLQDLLRLVRKWDREAGSAQWFEATEGALNAVEAESHRLPPGWAHLRRSVRAAIGEATGKFAFADRALHDPTVELPARCPIWAGNAEEYLTYALRSVRTWRDATSSTRRAPELVDFDVWLQRREVAPNLPRLLR